MTQIECLSALLRHHPNQPGPEIVHFLNISLLAVSVTHKHHTSRPTKFHLMVVAQGDNIIPPDVANTVSAWTWA
jgi:hypothetical protein